MLRRIALALLLTLASVGAEWLIATAPADAATVYNTVIGPSGRTDKQGVLGQFSVNALAAPSASVCGTSPSVAAGSGDSGGMFTTGTGSPAACTITFHGTWPSNPECTIGVEAAAATATAYISAKSTTAFTVTFSAGGAYTVDYHCGVGN